MNSNVQAFPSVAKRLLKEKFGPDFGVLCQVSAAGCQSPRQLPLTRDNEFWSERGVEVLGRRLFEAVMRGSERVGERCRHAGVHFHGAKEIRPPRHRVSYTEYQTAREEFDALERELPVGAAFEQFVAEVKANEKVPGRPGP